MATICGYNLFGNEIVYYNETKEIPLKSGTSIRMHTLEYINWMDAKLSKLQSDKADLVDFIKTHECNICGHYVKDKCEKYDSFECHAYDVIYKHKTSDDIPKDIKKISDKDFDGLVVDMKTTSKKLNLKLNKSKLEPSDGIHLDGSIYKDGVCLDHNRGGNVIFSDDL